MNKDLLSAGQRSARAGAGVMVQGTWVKQHHVEETALLALFLFALSFYKDYAPRSARAYSRTMDEQIEPGYHTTIEKTPDYSTKLGRCLTVTEITY